MASHASRLAAVARQVKPMMSNNPEAARRRVLQLYKAWYREIPETGNIGICRSITSEWMALLRW